MTPIYWDPRMVAGWVAGFVSCADLARTPALGKCAPGASVATIEPSGYEGNGITQRTTLADQVWPNAGIDAERRVAGLPVEGIVVGTNSSSAAIEEVRTAIETALGSQETQAPTTLGELLPSTAQSLAEAKNVTDVIIVASLIIAGCSLAVGVTAGVSERKRPFSLLRLTGVPIAILRRVVAIEAALPLIAAAVVSAGVGLLGAQLFLSPQLSVSLRWPGTLYGVVIVVGVLGSLGLIAATFPLIERITGPEVARNE